MSTLLLILLPLLISFGCGYGVRELISRRRRAAEREKFLSKHPEYTRVEFSNRGSSSLTAPSDSGTSPH
jgi:hypothetical protein